MMKLKNVLSVSVLLLALGTPTLANDTWEYAVRRLDPPRKIGVEDPVLPAETMFKALDAGSVKKHELCLLLPQTQDTIFMAYMYGAVSEAQRLGQSLTIFDAGGLENANQQRSQFDNCVTLGVNAIILQSSLPNGWAVQVE